MCVIISDEPTLDSISSIESATMLCCMARWMGGDEGERVE